MADAKKTAIIERYTDIPLEELKWLWPNRFPLGKFSMIVGVQGMGKSFLSLYMAAQISTGRPWCDCSEKREPGSVILMTTEDDASDTIKPRLAAAGADMSRIVRITGFQKEKGELSDGLFNLTKDVDVLRDAVRQIPDVKLIVIDPISSYLHGLDENKNSEARSFVTPLGMIAADYELAVVGISHLNKNEKLSPEHRILGSTGFGAAARAVWLVQEDKNDIDRKLMLLFKGNLAGKTTGLAYRLTSTQIVTDAGKSIPGCYCSFEKDQIIMTARDVMESQSGGGKKSERKESAKEWLWRYLRDGPRSSQDVFEDGLEAGHSKRTLERVKAEHDVQAIRVQREDGTVEGWDWALPTDEVGDE